MTSNLDKFKEDLERLTKTGTNLLKDLSKNQEKASVFHSEYQKWYSEAYEVVRQVLPNRLAEFEKLYHGDRRKEISVSTYTIQDWLLGIRSSVNEFTGQKRFEDSPAVIMRFLNQLQILKSAKIRFESTLFDIQQIVRADLFDSELDAAKELLKQGFFRAAGAMAGVVSEKHLDQVCNSHNIVLKKGNPNISDYNKALKEAGVVNIPNWRFIQHLADLRNLCGHSKGKEPSADEAEDLIEGVSKIIKTIF